MNGEETEHLRKIGAMSCDEFWAYIEKMYGYNGAYPTQKSRRIEIWEHRIDSSWLWASCGEIHTLVFSPSDWDTQ